MNVLYGPDISRNTNILNAYNAQAEMLKADLYQATNWDNSEPNRRIRKIQESREMFQDTPAPATAAPSTQTSSLMSQGEAAVTETDNKLSVLDQAGVELKLNNLEEERKRALYAIMKKYEDTKNMEEMLMKQNETLGLGASIDTSGLSATPVAEAFSNARANQFAEAFSNARAKQSVAEAFSNARAKQSVAEAFSNPTAIQRIGEFIDERHDLTVRMDNDIQTMNESILAAEREYYNTQHYIFMMKSVMAFLAVAILFIVLNKINAINDKVTMISISIVFIAFSIVLFLSMTKKMRDSKKMSMNFTKDLKELEEKKKNMI